jgi:hypothetical protein
MLFEFKLGTLIRRLNPYTNGGMRTMLCGPTRPVISPNLAAAVNTAAQAVVAYANDPGNDAKLHAAELAENAVDAAMTPIDIDVEMDSDYRQEYMNWTIRGRPYAVKRALLITYRYEIMRDGAGTGVFATDHVLVGYAGGNGG